MSPSVSDGGLAAVFVPNVATGDAKYVRGFEDRCLVDAEQTATGRWVCVRAKHHEERHG